MTVGRDRKESTVANLKPVESTDDRGDSLHEELLRLRAWMAAEARTRRSLARTADSGVLSLEYLQCEILRLDRRIAQLEQPAETAGPSVLPAQKASLRAA